MYFIELTLSNFGPFKGRHTLELGGLGSHEPPLTIIGALNGSGKTSILDSIRLALYGSRAELSNRGKLSYSDYLKSCINRHASDRVTSVELEFLSSLEMGQVATIRVCRNWSLASLKEKLEIFVNGKEDKALTKGWDEWIEALFPCGIANLFLVDGEAFSSIAESDKLPPPISQSIDSVLGLALPKRLEQDLKVLLSRKRKDMASRPEVEQIEGLEAQLNQLQKQKREVESQLADTQLLLSQAEVQSKQADDEYLREGGRVAENQANLKSDINQLRRDIDRSESQIRQSFESPVVLLIARNLLRSAHQQVLQEATQQQALSALSLQQQWSENTLQFAQQLPDLSNASLGQLQVYLEQQLELTRSQASGDSLKLDTSVEEAQSLKNLIEMVLPQLEGQLIQTATHLEECKTELDATEQYLARASEPERFEELKRTLQQAQSYLIKVQTELAALEGKKRQIEQSISQTQQAIQEFELTLHEYRKDKNLLSCIQKAQGTLSVFQERLKQLRLKQLEEHLTTCINQLARKEGFCSQAKVAEDYAITLLDRNKRPIPKDRLSAGERQMMATALLWALKLTSSRSIPVVIDTPMGRLDSEHRKRLVEVYFPDAAHQVIVLSTDTEVQPADLEKWQQMDEGKLRNTYLIEFNSETQSSEFKSGYFQPQLQEGIRPQKSKRKGAEVN